MLEELLDEARADGVVVTMWITPLHPMTTATLTQTTQYVVLRQRTADYVDELRVRYGIRTFDFSDPARFGAEAGGWYDCAHVDSTNADRLVKKLLGQT